MGNKEFNTNIDVIGTIQASNVPNSTGTFLTWNSSSRLIGTRTNAQVISDLGLQTALSAGDHISITSGAITVIPTVGKWIIDNNNNDRLLFGNTQSTDVVIKGAVANGDFKIKDSTDTDLFRFNGSNKVAYFPQLPALQTGDAYLAIFDSGNGLWKHSTRISDLVTTNDLTPLLNGKANVNGNNLTNIDGWRTAIPWDLQQVTDNGANTTNTININGLLLNNFEIRNNTPIQFYTINGFVQKIYTGGILASDNYADASLIPANGIYSKGTIATASHGTSADWDAKLGAGSNISLLNNDAGYITDGALGNYVSRLNVNENIDGEKTFIGNATQWSRNGINGFIQAFGGDFVFGTLTNNDVKFYRNAINKITIGDSSVSFSDNVIIPNATAPNHAVAFGQLGNYVPTSRTLTINGTTFDLSQDRTWNIPVNTYTGSNGINVTGTVISPTYGTTTNTIAQGNDARINNGQTAFGWGNHAGLYPLLSGSYANPTWITSIDWSKITNAPTIPTVGNGQLSFTAPTGLNITGTFNANQSGNTVIPLNWQAGYQGYTTTEANKLAGIQAGATVPNNGLFTVSGDGVYITGGGSTSANASANTSATLDLTAQTKSDIQQGVDANAIIPSVVEGVDIHYIDNVTPINIDIEKKKTIINIADGLLGVDVTVGEAPYEGYELAINGCNEWNGTIRGNIQNSCRIRDNISIGSSLSTSYLFWWSNDLGWVQAI